MESRQTGDGARERLDAAEIIIAAVIARRKTFEAVSQAARNIRTIPGSSTFDKAKSEGNSNYCTPNCSPDSTPPNSQPSSQ